MLVKFFGKNEIPKAALENTLPVLLHSCPDDFSTILYFNVWFLCCFPIVPSILKMLTFIFQTLETREIGRLVIYAPIINTTMTLVTNLNMQNGLVVIGRKQTAGIGRHKNQVHLLKPNFGIETNRRLILIIIQCVLIFSIVVEPRWMCTIFNTTSHSNIKSIGSKNPAGSTFSVGCHCRFDYKI